MPIGATAGFKCSPLSNRLHLSHPVLYVWDEEHNFRTVLSADLLIVFLT